MADILDVVTRLTFDVEDAELKQASVQVQNTIAKITQLTQQLTSYETKLKQTSRFELTERKRIQAQIDRTKVAITQQTSALESQIISNKKLQSAISQEIGLIGRLNAQMDVLKKKRDIANDPAKIQAYNRQIAATQGQLAGLTGVGGKGLLSGFGGAILQGVGIGTGIGLVTQGISELRTFIAESSRLAAETEGVRVAFNRLNKPDLLNNLRAATRGTVSDLELMKNAVQFNNFGLPVNKLATALEFARIRAKETGQSVDYLVQSITTGIGRQSPLILDNLGINARRVREEFQKTGDFAEAAFNIISEESAKAGKDLDTFSEKQARLNAQIQNAQAGFGEFFNDIQGGGFAFLEGLFTNGLTGAIAQLYAYKNALKEINDELAKPTGLGAALDRQVPRKKVTAQNATLQDIAGLTKEELDALKESIDNARSALTAADEAQIKRLNRLSTEVTKYQDIISGSGAKKAADAKNKEEEEQAKRIGKLIELQKELNLLSQKRPDSLDPNIIGETSDFTNGIPTQPPIGATQAEREAFNRADDGRGITFLTAEQIAADKKAKKDKEHAERESINKIIGYYSDAATSIISTFQMIYDAKLQFLDAEIQITSARITAATELAKRGNTEVLESEIQNLNKLQEEREKIANRQLLLNSLLQASTSALATVQAFQAVAATAASDPYFGAIRAAALVAGFVSAAAVIAGLMQGLQGFADGGFVDDGRGGFTGSGGKYDPAGIVHKGEFVFNQEKTKQFLPLFEAIHTGKIKDIPVMMGSNSRTDNRGMEKKLDELINIFGEPLVEVDTNIDEYGYANRIKRIAKRDKLRSARR